jgi:hypothetical protein
MSSKVEAKKPSDDAAVTEEELRSRDYITPTDVLSLKNITNGYLFYLVSSFNQVCFRLLVPNRRQYL